jgi:hypothetical protein
MRAFDFTVAGVLALGLAAPAAAGSDEVTTIGCGDLSISIDHDLSVDCEVMNRTGRNVARLLARVEYLVAETLGPIASHIVEGTPYDTTGIPSHGVGGISFAHPDLPSAYLDFPNPIIRVEILEAWDSAGHEIFRRNDSNLHSS